MNYVGYVDLTIKYYYLIILDNTYTPIIIAIDTLFIAAANNSAFVDG